MNTHLPTLNVKFSHRGFSLVEVVLAVGIMALGVVTILGLLPHGLEMSRKTANEQAETRILDQIVGEMQTTKWSSVDKLGRQTRYFDDQGLEITNGNQDFDILLSYVAEVNVPDADVKLPTNRDGVDVSHNLRRVMVKLIAAPLKNFDFNSPTPGVSVKVFTQLIANTTLALDLP